MPYTFDLGQQFGYATPYTAITHPSLPSYIAIAGGQTYGIANDDSPANEPCAPPTRPGDPARRGDRGRAGA